MLNSILSGPDHIFDLSVGECTLVSKQIQYNRNVKASN